MQRIHELRLKLEALDKRLVEASKAREARLRKAGAAGGQQMAARLGWGGHVGCCNYACGLVPL